MVRRQATSTLGASITFADRLRVGASLPLQLFAAGNRGADSQYVYAAPSSVFALGDLRIAAHYRLFGHVGDPLRFVLGAVVHAPTGDETAYAGAGSWRGEPQALAAGDIGAFVWAASAAVPLSSGRVFGGLALGNELVATGAVGYRFVDGRLLVGPEVRVVTSLESQLFQRRTSTYEPMIGAHYDIAEGWRVHAGAGTGIGDGLGSPTWRGSFAVQWAPIAPAVDAPPPPPPPSDRDGDGIADDADACPDVAGVASDEPTKHGCPLPPPPPTPPADTDGDGITDDLDACPNEPGPKNADALKNGCPAGAIVAGQLVLENVRFKSDSDVILRESDDTLNKVLATIKQMPVAQRFRIEGHTDNRGGEQYNVDLSARRARSVVAWFAKKGVDAQRSDAKGFGAAKPVDTNDTDDGRHHNRRVEIHLLGSPAK